MARVKNKRDDIPLGAWLCAGVICLILICYSFANRMPYLLNMHKMWFYFACSFTLTLTFFIYFVFFHQWTTTGRTGFQMRYSKEELENRLFRKKETLKSLALLTVFAAFFAWAAWGVVACAADVYSKELFHKTYIVNSLRDMGSGVDVGLAEVHSNDSAEYLLKQYGYYYLTSGVPWKIGDFVCAAGRTSTLGTIVEELKIGRCEEQ